MYIQEKNPEFSGWFIVNLYGAKVPMQWSQSGKRWAATDGKIFDPKEINGWYDTAEQMDAPTGQSKNMIIVVSLDVEFVGEDLTPTQKKHQRDSMGALAKERIERALNGLSGVHGQIVKAVAGVQGEIKTIAEHEAEGTEVLTKNV